MSENKFGINISMLPELFKALPRMENVCLTGIHFHIGSQITDMSAFKALSICFNKLQDELEAKGITLQHVNFGGGLGIDYYHPNHIPIPDFESYFAVFHKLINRRSEQQVHFELGRSIVGQCGTLISKVLYVKEGEVKKYAILDAGFSDLIRPAMYDAYHRIENISNDEGDDVYDIVGPICESSDVFDKDVNLNTIRRNDLIAIRSAGGYCESMASQYNCRPLPKSYFSDTI
jgi:diaminopimelate decarboxylase